MAIDLQKGFLHDIRRIGFARQATRQTKDAVLVAHHECFEGGIVSSRGCAAKTSSLDSAAGTIMPSILPV